ncbi:MAG: AI-2E family transporter [Ktedonobacterales bacterium]
MTNTTPDPAPAEMHSSEAISDTQESRSAAQGTPTPQAGPTPQILASTQEWTRRREIILTILLWALAVGIVFWLLSFVGRVILLLVISGLIAFALAPLTKLLARLLPRPLAIVLVYCAVLGAIGGLGYLVVQAALSEGAALTTQVQHFLSSGPHGAPSPLVQQLKALGISQKQINSVTSQLESQAQTAVPLLGQFVNDTLNLVIDIVLVLVLSIYMVVDGTRFGTWLRANAPVKQRPRVVFLISSVQQVVGGYIRGQLVLSTLIGLLVGLGMFALHVPFAILLGLLAFVLEFIPTIGTLTSGVVCILVAATQSWLLALLVLVYFVFIHVLDGYIVAPRVLGKAVGLHPAISIIALIAGADLFGIWGAIFAAPLAGLLQVLFAAVWQAWREQNPSQFSDAVVVGQALVPVTPAEARGETAVSPSLLLRDSPAR